MEALGFRPIDLYNDTFLSCVGLNESPSAMKMLRSVYVLSNQLTVPESRILKPPTYFIGP